MNIQLIHGEFSPADAIDLLSQMIQIKIKYHENKINRNSNEEDIKTREAKIKQLQSELSALKTWVSSQQKNIKMEAAVHLDS